MQQIIFNTFRLNLQQYCSVCHLRQSNQSAPIHPAYDQDNEIQSPLVLLEMVEKPSV